MSIATEALIEVITFSFMLLSPVILYIGWICARCFVQWVKERRKGNVHRKAA